MTEEKRAELSKAYAEDRRNREALADCPGPHDFDEMLPRQALQKRFRCSKCQGLVTENERFWYLEGLRAPLPDRS